MDQLNVANSLMCFLLQVYALLVATGGFCQMEHPAQWWRKESVSIWRCCYAKVLAAPPCSDLATLNGSIHGAPELKPITIMALRTPSLRKYVYNKQEDFEPPTRQTLLGGHTDRKAPDSKGGVIHVVTQSCVRGSYP